jgi:hypothetical protein
VLQTPAPLAYRRKKWLFTPIKFTPLEELKEMFSAEVSQQAGIISLPCSGSRLTWCRIQCRDVE